VAVHDLPAALDVIRRKLPKLTIVRAWQRAREAVFTPEVAVSPWSRRHTT
jgi:hypothetical protein